MPQGVSLLETNVENSHPDWFSQLLDDQQTETILEVLQSQGQKPSVPETFTAESEADKVNAIQEALEAVQGMNETNLNSADIVNQLSLILQLGLYQDPNEEVDKIDSSNNDFWSNSKNTATITPPMSRSNSPLNSDDAGDDDSDFVVVSRVKGNEKRFKSSKKNSKRLSSVPVMERMTEEATEEEQRLLKIAIQKAHNSRSDSDSQMKEPKYECPSCGRVFTRLYNLKSHIRSHQNYRPFKCLLCPASFTRNHDLNRHERTHNNSKPFACKYCGKLFARKDALGRHEKMDSQGKKTYCSSRAVDEANSSSYMGKNIVQGSVHSQDRIFQQNLQEHLRMLGTFDGI